jgi:hypothetical protein
MIRLLRILVSASKSLFIWVLGYSAGSIMSLMLNMNLLEFILRYSFCLDVDLIVYNHNILFSFFSVIRDVKFFLWIIMAFFYMLFSLFLSNDNKLNSFIHGRFGNVSRKLQRNFLLFSF